MGTLWDEIVTRLQDFIDTEIANAGLVDEIADVVVGLLIFAGFLIIWAVLGRLLRTSLRRAKLDETAASFIMTLAKYAFLGIGAVYALSAAGIDTAALVASLGIAGLTIGFAARDSLSNLISGLLIFIYQPFVIGDLIEVDDLYGQVDTITLSSTRVISIDGKMLTIPNTQIINKTVASYTKFPNLRLEIPVTVAPNEDLGRIRQILIDLVEKDEEFMTEPQPIVVVSELNISNIKIMLAAWLKDERDHLTKRFQLRERVFTTLREAGVDMP